MVGTQLFTEFWGGDEAGAVNSGVTAGATSGKVEDGDLEARKAGGQ